MTTPFTVQQMTNILWGGLNRPHLETSESFLQESRISWIGVDDTIKDQIALAAAHCINKAHDQLYGELNQQMTGLFTLLNARFAEVNLATDNLSDAIKQVSNQQTRSQIKVTPPKEFMGSNSGTDVEDWLDLVSLWLAGVVDDDERICLALSRIGGSAQKFLKKYHTKLSKGKPLGTWQGFK